MIVDVSLDTNRLIVTESTAPEELQSLTYINIVRVLPIVREQRDFSVDGAPVLYDQWYARLIDATNTQLDIPLGNLASWPGWTNDQDGYDQAEADIYAAFPAGGGGGSGTVTSINVSGGTTGFTFTGGPVTTSGTITMTGAPTILAGNTLYVDDVNGNDGTGTRGVFNKPYLTIAGAIADASEGDLIQIRPGTYATGISDAGSTLASLLFEVQPGALLGSSVIDSGTASSWQIYGSAVDTAGTLGVEGGANVVIHGDVAGGLAIDTFGSVSTYGSVLGSIDIDQGFLSSYNGRLASISATADSTISLDNCSVVLISSTDPISVNANGSSVDVATNITFIGSMFLDSTPTPDSIAAANADGSWSWNTSLLAGKVEVSVDGVLLTAPATVILTGTCDVFSRAYADLTSATPALSSATLINAYTTAIGQAPNFDFKIIATDIDGYAVEFLNDVGDGVADGTPYVLIFTGQKA